MISQTDRNNLAKLKELRYYKMQKATIEAEKAKQALKQTLAEEVRIKKTLEIYRAERKQKHQQLSDSLKQTEKITIETLNVHSKKNHALITGEEEIQHEIESLDKLLHKNQQDLQLCQDDLREINKQIESLKEIKLQFFKKKTM